MKGFRSTLTWKLRCRPCKHLFQHEAFSISWCWDFPPDSSHESPGRLQIWRAAFFPCDLALDSTLEPFGVKGLQVLHNHDGFQKMVFFRLNVLCKSRPSISAWPYMTQKPSAGSDSVLQSDDAVCWSIGIIAMFTVLCCWSSSINHI